MLSVKQYDELIMELGSEDLTLGRKTIILDELRRNYKELSDSYTVLQEEVEKAEEEKKELAEINRELFKKVGEKVLGVEGSVVPKEKSFSQTITIEALEASFN